MEVWKLNTNLKKRKTKWKKGSQQSNPKKDKPEDARSEEGAVSNELPDLTVSELESAEVQDPESTDEMLPQEDDDQSDSKEDVTSNGENKNESGDCKKHEMKDDPLKFRVTCNRAGDNHSFKSNEAARDFGGAVQDFFQWKADMTNFDVEVQRAITY